MADSFIEQNSHGRCPMCSYVTYATKGMTANPQLHSDLTLGSLFYRVINRDGRCSALSFQATILGLALRMRTLWRVMVALSVFIALEPAACPRVPALLLGRLPEGFGQHVRNRDVALCTAKAITQQPFVKAHGQGDRHPGVTGCSAGRAAAPFEQNEALLKVFLCSKTKILSAATVYRCLFFAARVA